ncbi:hypothetical protein [Hymenobacter properus]|uniref:PorT family protein n=1 Tax=Hymenobacter properus TaxID=2791026 RepID=A0A931BD29_9BACT|nr:hypothetical protein [Hymenobacter properus]MBF9141635.1 hypothetical protein [Hymenobacter properus]MBR7720444.1 hypothetical protein [Microvirga sp. SRT04]
MRLIYTDFHCRCWGLLLLLALAGPAAAQQPEAAPHDSLALPEGPPCLPPAPAHRRVGFVLSLDNRESFVQSSAVHVVGLNAGVVLPNHRWRLGVGGYTLSRDYATLYTYQYKNGKRTKKIADTLTPQLSLTYLTPNVSYVFVHRPWLEISLPLEVGLGRSHYTVTDQNGNTPTNTRGLFVPVEAGVAVLLKPFRWVGVSGSLGYRKSVFEVDYKEDFDGLYFSYRLNVFVGVIWHDWRRHQQGRHFAREAAEAHRSR